MVDSNENRKKSIWVVSTLKQHYATFHQIFYLFFLTPCTEVGTIATNLFNIFIKVDEAPIAYKSQMHPPWLHSYFLKQSHQQQRTKDEFQNFSLHLRITWGHT